MIWFQNPSFTFSQSTKSMARSRQNLIRSSPLSMMHSWWICEAWFTMQPLHSFTIASLRTVLTTRAIASTSCNWNSMVEWWPSLCAADYIDPQTFSKRLGDSSVMVQYRLELASVTSIFRMWETPMTHQTSYRRPQWWVIGVSNIWQTLETNLGHLLYCAMSQLDPSFYIWIHLIMKTIEIGL